jgi:hypothetical protein
MRMRYLAFFFAAVIAALAMQNVTATKSAPVSLATMNIMELQMVADKNLPEMVIAEPY